MKTAKELTALILDKAQSNPTSNTSATQKGIKEDEILECLKMLFTIFAVSYKNSWTDALYSEEMRRSTDAIWFKALKKFSPDTIIMAAEDAIKTHKFPPNIAEFLEITTALQRKEKYNTEMNQREKNRLIEKKPNKEVAKSYMAQIMKKLGRKSINES